MHIFRHYYLSIIIVYLNCTAAQSTQINIINIINYNYNLKLAINSNSYYIMIILNKMIFFFISTTKTYKHTQNSIKIH